MKERLHKEIKSLLIHLGIGFAYLIFVLITGWRIPCIIKLITGFDCPGCGITRMFVSIARFDLAAAFHYNAVMFTTLPLIIGYLAYDKVTYIKSGTHKMPLAWKFFFVFEILLLIAYGMIRNFS